MIRSFYVLIVFAVGSSPARAETPPPALALNGLDPLALAEGKETPGKESIEAAYGRFVYRFASEASKKAFLARADERAIQFGGACGKMGPFSGTGNPARYHVHDGRIYIFASEFCRDAFRKDPEKHIDRPNPVPKGSEEEQARGMKLIDRVLDGFGGAKGVDAARTLRRVEKIVYKQGDKETVGTGRTTWVFPDTVRVEEDYGTPYGHIVKGKGGFELYGKQDWTLEPAMRDDAWRRALREPLVMLCNRQAKGFVAVSRGPNSVEVSLDGASSTWTLDEKTGRILRAEFKARRGTVGDIAVSYDDFKPVGSLVLPHKRIEFFNGKEVTVPQKRIESLEVNGDVKGDLFVQPK